MGKPTGFLERPRQEPPHRPVRERVKDFRAVELPHPPETLAAQAARCMECGVPFCHSVGCPLGNRVPEFNDLVYRGRWREAAEVLHATNNFPEFTGRLCPALCEASCTLSINDEPVLIRAIEQAVVERAWQEGWIVPLRPALRTGRKVAIVGSGPAGLAAAQQLARAGHDVTVFEKDDRIGGLLRYGIPDYKLPKEVLDRRLTQLAEEGVVFQTGAHVGQDLSAGYLRRTHDAVLLTMGAGRPRDLDVPGRHLKNVLFALEYLSAQNRRGCHASVCGSVRNTDDPGAGLGDMLPQTTGKHGTQSEFISAEGKIVVVLGGGDTGSDCVGTARRQGAKEIHQFEILPRPPEGRNPATPWPNWPIILRTSSAHEEGCQRRWGVMTTRLSGHTQVEELHGVEVQWTRGAKSMEMHPVAGTEFHMKADLVLLALGFVHVVHYGLVSDLGLRLDERGNVAVGEAASVAAETSAVAGFATSAEGVFAAGDTHRGASLVVHAISSGRLAADAIDRWLR